MNRINGLRAHALIALLLFTFASTVFSWAPIASADNESSLLSPQEASTVGQQNITMHTGDLVLGNNDVLLIKDAQLNLKGNLVMSGNSILILDNGVLYPDFEKGQYSYKLYENSKIVMQNNSKIESLIFDFILYDNAGINITESNLAKSIILERVNATLQAVNSHISTVDAYGGGGTSQIRITNSTAGQLRLSCNSRLVDSHIDSIVVTNNISPIYVDVINSTYDQLDTSNLGQGIVRTYWYLTVLVESQGTPVQDAVVQIYSQANNSLVAEQTTSSEGTAQFELPALEISEHGETQIGEYTIRVNQNQTQVQENVTLNASMEKTVSLSADLQIIIFAVIAVIVILVVVVFLILLFRKKRKQ
ncbi:MAG: carboxypeptidase-like regulatory domain-containing protein [Thermoproteota archaeon]|nr:carboxypeptidase-like regulatory domain-containing protein [Thermoproteota archaeon]NLD66156.1 hypothetical protein [Thermoproteota archaeon]